MKRYRRNMAVTFALFLIGAAIMLAGVATDQIMAKLAGVALALTSGLALLAVAHRYDDYTRDERPGQAR